jgi:hypothetical protein
LGILEASLVPDPDEVGGTDDLVTSVSSILLDEKQQNGGESQLLGTTSGGLSRTTSTSDSGLAGGETASGGTGLTGGAEYDVDSPEDELDLLQSLFPNLYVRCHPNLCIQIAPRS